jgi:glycosyltransferase involved in cell wall biosynthesis
MRIAQIAPMYEAVPPTHYGGTERVAWNICEELVKLGHDVTLFASGDSQTSATLEITTPRALRHLMTRQEIVEVAPLLHLEMMSKVYSRAYEFDVIHSHIDDLLASLPLGRLTATPSVTTLHGTLDRTHLPPILSCYPEAPLVSISMSQRLPLCELPLNWAGCVYNGIPLDHFSFRSTPGTYLAFVGRICPEKGIAWAVEVARRAGMPLKVGAKIDLYDRRYWEEQIEPLFKANRVEFLGELTEAEKADLLANAYATLFPIDWPEPFGLVMPESLACGTPVIARNRGSVPEIVRDGVSGFICETLDEMVAAVEQVAGLNRHDCRREAERFSSAAMARGYLQVYTQLIEARCVGAVLASARAVSELTPGFGGRSR